MSKSKVSIEKIVVKMGDMEVALSPEQAKELKELLNELFGEAEVVYIPGGPIVIREPYPVYPYPWTYWDTTITWSGTGQPGTMTYSLSDGG